MESTICLLIVYFNTQQIDLYKLDYALVYTFVQINTTNTFIQTKLHPCLLQQIDLNKLNYTLAHYEK